MEKKEKETFYAASRDAWRAWLKAHHRTKPSIWLVYYKKHSGVPTLSWSEAVDEALCFGWIDSTRVSDGEGRSLQFFTKRKPSSSWSKINKEKVEQLIAAELMTQAGYESIEIAKSNGTWSQMDEVEELTMPQDLAQALNARPGAMDFYNGLSKSVRKMFLTWVTMAKRPETREKRILEIAEHAAQQLKPKQFR